MASMTSAHEKLQGGRIVCVYDVEGDEVDDMDSQGDGVNNGLRDSEVVWVCSVAVPHNDSVKERDE